MHDVALSHILMSIHFSAPALLRCLRALYLWLSALMQCTAPNPSAAEHTLFVYLFVCLFVCCEYLVNGFRPGRGRLVLSADQVLRHGHTTVS